MIWRMLKKQTPFVPMPNKKLLLAAMFFACISCAAGDPPPAIKCQIFGADLKASTDEGYDFCRLIANWDDDKNDCSVAITYQGTGDKRVAGKEMANRINNCEFYNGPRRFQCTCFQDNCNAHNQLKSLLVNSVDFAYEVNDNATKYERDSRRAKYVACLDKPPANPDPPAGGNGPAPPADDTRFTCKSWAHGGEVKDTEKNNYYCTITETLPQVDNCTSVTFGGGGAEGTGGGNSNTGVSCRFHSDSGSTDSRHLKCYCYEANCNDQSNMRDLIDKQLARNETMEKERLEKFKACAPAKGAGVSFVASTFLVILAAMNFA